MLDFWIAEVSFFRNVPKKVQFLKNFGIKLLSESNEDFSVIFSLSFYEKFIKNEKKIVKFEEKIVYAGSVQHLVQQGALSEHIWNLCSIYQNVHISAFQNHLQTKFYLNIFICQSSFKRYSLSWVTLYHPLKFEIQTSWTLANDKWIQNK